MVHQLTKISIVNNTIQLSIMLCDTGLIVAQDLQRGVQVQFDRLREPRRLPRRTGHGAEEGLWLPSVRDLLRSHQYLCRPLYRCVRGSIIFIYHELLLILPQIQVLSVLPLYIHPGPWSDLGRKPILILPFIGHVLSGIVPLLVLYYETWGAIQYAWKTSRKSSHKSSRPCSKKSYKRCKKSEKISN